MFTPWVRRKSLKKASKGNRLMVASGQPSLIVLLSMAGLLVVVGVYVVHGSSAAPVPHVTPTPSPSASPTPTVSPGGDW